MKPVPVVDTYFILTATDSLGMVEIDSVLFDTKFTRAEFSLSYLVKYVTPDTLWSINYEWNADDETNWSTDLELKDAPLSVRFVNESENGAEFTWVFLDTFNTVQQEGLKRYLDTTVFDYKPVYTYYNAEKFYYPYLVSISDANCRDTFKLDDGIHVVQSELDIPNVFSPNGDGINDYWVFKHQSIKECRVTIMSKSGMVVYRDKIDDIYQWGGWNGKIYNNTTKASEGQYYYVIEALGYDNREHRDRTMFEQWKDNREAGGGSNPGTSVPSEEGTDPGAGASSKAYTGWLYLFL